MSASVNNPPAGAYLTREEALVYYNRRGWRPGIIGMTIDSASGAALDRAARHYGLQRERASWHGFTLPWRQSDEQLRGRVWLAFQEAHRDPKDTSIHIYP